jgi:putative MATE family efflux protein
MERNLTTGSVFRTILYFALPYLLSYTLQTLYGMADLFIIGQFNGVEAITAVTNGSQIMHMLTVIIVGLAMGVTVTIGQAVGAGKRGEASGIVGNTIILFASISVVLTVVLIINVKNIVRLVGVPTEAVDGTIQYLVVCFAGIPFITAYNVISAIFRGMGDSKRPMYYIAVACVANIVIDYVLIGVFGMGALGAALGTTLSQTLSVIISLIAIIKTDTGLRLKKSDMSADRALMSEILKIGVPVAVQDGCIQVAFIIITVIANSRGLDDAAAVGIVEKIISALFIMPSSMLATVSALAAQNIGAGRQDRASQTLWYATLMALVYGVLVTVLVEFNTSTVVGWFTADVAVITLGAQYISSYITDCIFAGVHFSFTGYFAACGKSYIGFIHNILAIALVRVPGSYLASLYYPDTLFPMGVAAPAGSLLSVLICLAAYWILRRKTHISR